MSQPPFATFLELAARDPFDLAAGSLPLLFRGERQMSERSLRHLLRGWVAESGTSVLGFEVGVPPELEVATHRTVLIWERALVASRTFDVEEDSFGSIGSRFEIHPRILLLDPDVLMLPHPELVAHLRQPTVRENLR